MIPDVLCNSYYQMMKCGCPVWKTLPRLKVKIIVLIRVITTYGAYRLGFVKIHKYKSLLYKPVAPPSTYIAFARPTGSRTQAMPPVKATVCQQVMIK